MLHLLVALLTAGFSRDNRTERTHFDTSRLGITVMSMIKQDLEPDLIDYPEDNGEPMAENTLQYEWIVTIKGGLDAAFRNRPDVFVASDLLWYPVKGQRDPCTAPDAMVVIGRPKGHRRSYLQWNEDGIAPQVVFEVLSPGNRPGRMAEKFQFYETHGVEEYYVYDPDNPELAGWTRVGDRLTPIDDVEDWTSPLLGVRFEMSTGTLKLYGPDGRVFQTYLETVERAEEGEQRAIEEHNRADAERRRADAKERQLEAERRRADAKERQLESERQRADAKERQLEIERQRADSSKAELETERARADRLARKLRELGIEPE